MSDLNVIRPSPYYADASKSDSVDVPKRNNRFPTGISLSEEAALKVNDLDGNAVTFASGELASGVVHPIRVSRVWLTGTSVTTVKLYYDN